MSAMEDGVLTYSPTEAAEQLGVGVGRVYDLCASGEIGAVRLGTRWRIPNRALYRYGTDHGLIRDRFTDLEDRAGELERQVSHLTSAMAFIGQFLLELANEAKPEDAS